MKNPKQYKETGTPIEAPALTKKSSTKSSADIKLAQLEEQLRTHQQEVAKLRRDLGRLKNAISDLESVVKNRG